MAISEDLIATPFWWASHLHEAVARGTGDEEDCVPYLNAAFGTSLEGINRFWKEVMLMDQKHGYWPQVHLGLPRGHVVSIVYFGSPRYDVEYRYGSPSGESVLLAVEGPESMLPGFRWAEVRAIASLVPHIRPLALLVLTPAACVVAPEEAAARTEISQALSELGYSSAASTDLAAVLAKGLRYDMEWTFDDSYGWVTSEKYCWRCPTRSQYGLNGMSRNSFLALKSLTKDLGLNPDTEG